MSEQITAPPTSTLHGVGATRAKHLAALGVNSLKDLLEYFPRDYRHELAESSIAQLVVDKIQTVRGTVVACDYIPSHPRPRFEATLEDGTRKLALTFFNGAYLRRLIHPGMSLRVRGKVTLFRGIARMNNPKWEQIEAESAPLRQASFLPVYPASQQLPSDAIARIIAENIDEAATTIEEWFEPALLAKRNLMPRREAYKKIHRPADPDEAAAARRRLVYDELMQLQLALALAKQEREGRISAPMMRLDRLLDQRIRARFPFSLTDAQQRAIIEITNDLRTGQAMNRLLQGDVGSGKTIVALYAMLVAVANRMQAAILAPTEVLAEQHALTLSELLRESSVRVELLTSRTKRQSRGKIERALSSGEIHIAVGTQALLQADIDFANLGLVVVDEQHKLGVQQRATLKGKGFQPHYLVMTATPIPRSLALSYFADFDLSTIDQLPPGRQPIETRWLAPKDSAEAYDFVWRQSGLGRQSYIVVPQIDQSEDDDAKSVTAHFERLRTGPLRQLRLGMLHGQLSAIEKQQVMSEFRLGKIDALVATTVIEVGVDVPNATVMVIENADRFGLSQLHQLRGRVGRGKHPSHCLLIADAGSDATRERLEAMTRTSSGFEIAEIDLTLRGPGEFFGTRQHGLPPLKLTKDIGAELKLLQLARDDAQAILKDDPALRNPPHRVLRAALLERFGATLNLARIG